jgi:hypothetical protein
MSELDLLRGLGDQIAPPSFDDLAETARRRTHRTTTAAVFAAAAGVALVGGVTFLALADQDSEAQPVEQPGDTTHPLTYALGPTIHYGDRTVTAPAPVVEVDVTDDGVLARSDDGTIWFTDGDGIDQVGTLGAPGPAYRQPDHPYATTWGFVVSGNTGSRAGWLEFPQPGVPELVVYDTGTREEVARHPLGVDPGSYALLESVNDRYGYWFTSPEMNADDRSFPEARVDLASGARERVTEKEYDADGPAVDTPRTMMVSHDGEDGRTVPMVHDAISWQFDIGGGRVEPQGAQPLDARDGGTGRRFRFDAPDGYPDAAPNWLSQWLDDDTVVITVTRHGNDDLLECHFSTGGCTVAASVPEEAVMPDIG